MYIVPTEADIGMDIEMVCHYSLDTKYVIPSTYHRNLWRSPLICRTMLQSLSSSSSRVVIIGQACKQCLMMFTNTLLCCLIVPMCLQMVVLHIGFSSFNVHISKKNTIGLLYHPQHRLHVCFASFCLISSLLLPAAGSCRAYKQFSEADHCSLLAAAPVPQQSPGSRVSRARDAEEKRSDQYLDAEGVIN